MRWDRNYEQPQPINDPVVIPAYGVTDEERAYWNKKQEALEYDRYPTLRSDKHCTSGVIHRALEDYKVQAVELAQAFFWGHAEGLALTKEACEAAAVSANESKLAAAGSESSAAESQRYALDSKNAAALSESNAFASKNAAATSAQNSLDSSRDSEAWATGKRNGVDVPSTDPAYHNNARYYAALGSDILQDEQVTDYTTWSSSKLSPLFAGKADLVDGKVPAAQLPSYVDDIEEYASLSEFPTTGETGKIYTALDTNKLYRWSGSVYSEVSESLALGETSSTAYAGDKGKANADAITGIEAKIPSNASAQNKLATVNDLPTSLSGLTEDASHRTVTDTEKTSWNSKAAGDHNHDDRYYTETEMNTALAGKSDTGHTHDDRYYTETEIDNKFNGVTFTTEDGVDYINW